MQTKEPPHTKPGWISKVKTTGLASASVSVQHLALGISAAAAIQSERPQMLCLLTNKMPTAIALASHKAPYR
eukprot:scaffold267390_cov24-Tisochrysis_lutea.AAC.1